MTEATRGPQGDEQFYHGEVLLVEGVPGILDVVATADRGVLACRHKSHHRSEVPRFATLTLYHEKDHAAVLKVIDDRIPAVSDISRAGWEASADLGRVVVTYRDNVSGRRTVAFGGVRASRGMESRFGGMVVVTLYYDDVRDAADAVEGATCE